MTDQSAQYGDDGYGPPPSKQVEEIRDEFLVWPRPYTDTDTPPSTDTPQ
jgi:hypothetical protein